VEQALILAASFVLILAGAELFTNGIEWFGHRLNLAEGAVGSVLAAVGTALPETMIPIVAILGSGATAASEEIGIGAILGAPFMLSTLAMFVTGVAVLSVARSRVLGDTMLLQPAVIFHDIRWFFIGYAIAIGAAFLPADLAWPRLAVAGVLIVLYALYVREHFGADSAGGFGEELRPLRLRRLDAPSRPADVPPRLRIVSVQVVAALVLIVGGALAFVGAVEHIAEGAGVSATILALIVAPIATELPEKLNSVIWVRQDKDTLAMGNITGAMVFQSMIPTVVALVFAPSAWSVSAGEPIVFASVAIAFASSAAIFVPMRMRGVLRGRWLLVGGLFYAAFLALVFLGIGTGSPAAA
jgi:cation:H+ antiporter